MLPNSNENKGSKTEVITLTDLENEDVFTFQHLKNGKIKKANTWFSFGRMMNNHTLSVIELKHFEFSTLDSNQIFNLVRLKRKKKREDDLFENNLTQKPKNLKKRLSEVQFPENFVMFRFRKGKLQTEINGKLAKEMHDCFKVRLENASIIIDNQEYTEDKMKSHSKLYECKGQFYLKEKNEITTNVCALSFVE